MGNRVAYRREQVAAFLKSKFPEIEWSDVVEKLPLIVWRSRWDKLAERLGLPYSSGHIKNLDSDGKGPASYQA